MTSSIKENNGIWVATLVGRLDTDAAVTFEQEIAPLIQNADKKIVLDCSQLEYISSSGLRLLLMLRKQTNAKGGDIVLQGVNSAVKQVFALTGFSSLFKFE